jgi:hypothetical protein
MKHEGSPPSPAISSLLLAPPSLLLMSLIDNQTGAVMSQDASLRGPGVFVTVSWQPEPEAGRPGWQLAVSRPAALPENGPLPVELQLPPLLLPLLSIACRCCINIPPAKGTAITARLHAMSPRHVNFSSGTIKEGNTVPPCFFFFFFVAAEIGKGDFFNCCFFSSSPSPPQRWLFHKGSEIHPHFLTALFPRVELFCKPLCGRPVATHSGYGNGAKVLWAKRIGHSEAQGA